MIKTTISGGFNEGYAAVVKKQLTTANRKSPRGLVTYNTPYYNERARFAFATDASGSVNLNINGSTTGGTPDRIHDGIDSVLWTGSNFSGSNFTFNSTTQAQSGTQSINATSTVHNDEAELLRGSAINHSDYTALTGWIYIESWPSSGTKDVRFKFKLAGVDVSNVMNLQDYVNIGNQNVWQTFTIPLNVFSLSGTQIDSLHITTIDIGGGQAPNYHLDELVLTSSAAAGNPETFTIKPVEDEIMYLYGVEFDFAFPYAPIATVSGATENFTTPKLSFDQFCHLSQLVNGVTIRLIQNNITTFSGNIKSNYHLLSLPNTKLTSFMADETNTFIKAETDFSGVLELDARTNDRIEFTINDNLSALLAFQISVKATTVKEAL